jgi:L-asparaginase II
LILSWLGSKNGSTPPFQYKASHKHTTMLSRCQHTLKETKVKIHLPSIMRQQSTQSFIQMHLNLTSHALLGATHAQNHEGGFAQAQENLNGCLALLKTHRKMDIYRPNSKTSWYIQILWK